ncbi:hypothetical protein [Paludibaculum fermentans]|uniref:hypothetical protein n=1 Tax=Paludibaculum fermentans TaxID=1473598 RepID=UPI003EB770F5
MSILDELRMTLRYTRGLPSFLRHPLTPDASRQLLRQCMAARNTSFLTLLERGIFRNPQSPYRPLFQHAGITLADLTQRTNDLGVEGALQSLLDAGLFIQLAEFKGQRPLDRLGYTAQFKSEDFDNPLVRAQFSGRTGGSSGPARRLLLDLDLLNHDAACHYHHLLGLDALQRPYAVWRPVPPDNSGIKKLLMFARLGIPLERWFSQSPVDAGKGQWKYFFFTRQTLAFSRLFGRPQPSPIHVPVTEAGRIAQFLAGMRSQGRPAYLDTLAGCAVRVCQAARAADLDISGTLFRVGGEALTAAKAQAVADAGCRIVCHYSMSELGHVAMACTDATDIDDVHLLLSKVAVIQRADGALLFTSIHPNCPKLMLNVETGDTATLERRTCGCPFGQLGFDLHLHHIRSYEKLTSEGMHFLGMELTTLLEEVLPRAFGGGPSDYQLMEHEVGGLSRVALIVSPGVGAIDEPLMLRTALEFLASHSRGHQLMAKFWQDGSTLQIRRQEPFATKAGKILPLHIHS